MPSVVLPCCVQSAWYHRPGSNCHFVFQIKTQTRTTASRFSDFRNAAGLRRKRKWRVRVPRETFVLVGSNSHKQTKCRSSMLSIFGLSPLYQFRPQSGDVLLQGSSTLSQHTFSILVEVGCLGRARVAQKLPFISEYGGLQ